jgi:hypothetical protein
MHDNVIVKFATNIINNYIIHNKLLEGEVIYPYKNEDGSYNTQYSINIRTKSKKDKLVSKIRFYLPDKKEDIRYSGVMKVKFDSNRSIESIVVVYHKLELPINIYDTPEGFKIELEESNLLSKEEFDKLSEIVFGDINNLSWWIAEFNSSMVGAYDNETNKQKKRLKSFISEYTKCKKSIDNVMM